MSLVGQRILSEERHHRLLRRAGLGLALAIAVLAGIIEELVPVDSFKATHWAFSYEWGFSKRALAGEILSWLWPSPLPPAGPLTAGLVVLGLAIGLFLAVSARALIKTQSLFLYGFVLFLCLSPFGPVRAWSYDIGRFDQINYALLMMAVLAMGALRHPGLIWPLVTAVSALMLVFHEGALFLQIPLLFYSALLIRLFQTQDRAGGLSSLIAAPRLYPATVTAASVSGLIVMMVFLAISQGGRVMGGMAQVGPILEARADYTVDYYAAWTLWNSLGESIARSWDYRNFGLYLVDVGLLTILALAWGTPVIWMFVRAVRTTMPGFAADIRLHLFICATPLLMIPLALDYWRWVTAALIGLSLMSLVLIAHHPGRVMDGLLRAAWRDMRHHPIVAGAALIIMVATIFAPGPGHIHPGIPSGVKTIDDIYFDGDLVPDQGPPRPAPSETAQ